MRAWWKDCDEVAVDAELAHLRAEVYKNPDLELPLSRFTGKDRFSMRV